MLKKFKYIWIIGILVTLTIIIIPIAIFLPKNALAEISPWENVPIHRPHTDHSSIVEGPFNSGSEVTRACLECHEDAAYELMQTVHWTWESQPYFLDDREGPVTVGKKNSLNNFCIGIQSNWEGCTSCHAGYGWDSANFDFSNQENVDCLVCHDSTGTYIKGKAGYPAEGVDLELVAKSVAAPTRENCGGCHFDGGGGNAVKHGDLDEHLYFPPSTVDVHMGKHDFQCTDCHQTESHLVSGRSISVSMDDENQIYCTDCHAEQPHDDDRVNAHVQSVACQTCHIPSSATREATKVYWDWSTAGSDEIEENVHTYLKIKGSFVYESDIVPEYFWYNGTADRYIMGDVLNPEVITPINQPNGDISDLTAKIWPFKVHRAKQPYDVVYNYLLQPKTVGEGGFWTEFNWDQAFRLGSEATGLAYSGEYGFTETEMFWPTTHMVVPSEDALTCNYCHGTDGRMDWEKLGYYGDPVDWGGRIQTNDE